MTVENGAAYGAHICPSGAHSSRQLRMTLPAVSHSVRLSRHATRAALTEIVKGRFPELLTPEMEKAIADQPSLPLMRQWIAAAARAKSADDFLAVLRR